MLDVSVTAPGLDVFDDQARAAGQALDDLDGPSRVAAALVLGDVRPPVRTGALAKTVEAVPTAFGFTLTAGGPSAPYGPIVHARDPFLSRPLLARESDVLDIYADHVDDVLSTIK